MHSCFRRTILEYEITLGQSTCSLGSNFFPCNRSQYALLLWCFPYEDTDYRNPDISGDSHTYCLWCRDRLFTDPCIKFPGEKNYLSASCQERSISRKEGAQGNSVGMRNFMYVSLPCSYLCPYYDDSAGTDPKYYGSDLQFSSLCEGYSEMAAIFH